MTTLETLLENKRHAYADAGFKPVFMPYKLFPFQSALVEWAVRNCATAGEKREQEDIPLFAGKEKELV